MPAYISVADVRGLAASDPREGSPDADADARLQEVIDALLSRVDEFTGQYLSSSYTGAYRLKRKDIKHRGLLLCVPRMYEVEAVEYRVAFANEWETVDTSQWHAYNAHPQRYSGYDTIEMGYPLVGSVRVHGNIGWGFATTEDSNPLTADPVPPKVALEVKKQARYDVSRLGIGGLSGSALGGMEMEIDMDTFEFLISTRQVLLRLIDKRRLTGG